MHKSQEYIRKHFIIGDNLPIAQITSATLDAINSKLLDECLKHDAASYLYSSIVSIGDAINGINNKYYSWATVKLYYSAFYSIRALLSAKGICLFYVGTKPFSIHVTQNASPKKESGTTHKVVYGIYERTHPNNAINTQLIDLKKPLEWLMSQREEANYKNARFSEPNMPAIYKKMTASLSTHIKQYLADTKLQYAFDQEHAILSLPIHLIKEGIDAYNNLNVNNVSHEEAEFLVSLFDHIDDTYDLISKINSLPTNHIISP